MSLSSHCYRKAKERKQALWSMIGLESRCRGWRQAATRAHNETKRVTSLHFSTARRYNSSQSRYIMATSTNGTAPEKTYFEQQRELLINDVATVCQGNFHAFYPIKLTASQSMENVLQNINKLNRSLEGVIAV